MLYLTKEYLQEEELTVYTISLDDGQELVINEYEFDELKEKIRNYK